MQGVFHVQEVSIMLKLKPWHAYYLCRRRLMCHRGMNSRDVCTPLLVLPQYPSSAPVHCLASCAPSHHTSIPSQVMLFLALKLALPSNVYMLRGNHESSTCTRFYGFKVCTHCDMRVVRAHGHRYTGQRELASCGSLYFLEAASV